MENKQNLDAIMGAFFGSAWGDNQTSAKAEKPGTATPTVDLDSMSILDKSRIILEDTLNKLLMQETEIENGQELFATMQAVAQFYQMESEYSNV